MRATQRAAGRYKSPNSHLNFFFPKQASVSFLLDELDFIFTNDIQKMYSLFVDSTKWAECQLHLEGVTAIQNSPDNLKMWADINNST